MTHRILLLILTLCASFALLPSAAQSCSEPIRIGAVFPANNLLTMTTGEPLQGVQAMVETLSTCERPIEFIRVDASNRNEALKALETLDVPLIIGGGNDAVSEALTQASANGDFVYWEVSEPLDPSVSDWAFSPRPTRAQLGNAAVSLVTTHIPELIGGQEPRAALIYEERFSEIAEGVLDVIQPQIVHRYVNNFHQPSRIAKQIREQKIDVVIIATFERDANYFWYELRQADANIAAWVQIGGQLVDSCDAYAAISVEAFGDVSRVYRRSIMGDVYERYTETYQHLYDEAPGERADLAAAGVYLLLTTVERLDAPEAIREAIVNTTLPAFNGMMGEGLTIDAETGINTSASTIIQQRQSDGYCTITPDALATCANPLQSFPTWRERAVAQSKGRCGVDQRDTA